MGEAVIPDNILDTINKLEERVRTLESASRLQSSSLRDGTLTMQDQNGFGVVYLGKLTDGTHGISVNDSSGRVLFRVSSERGQVAPFALAAPLPSLDGVVSGTTNSFRPGTSSVAFVELWRSDLFTVGPTVNYDFTMFANGGNMSWQLLCYEYVGGAQTVVASGTETTNVQRQGTFTIPAACLLSGTDPVGRYLTIRVQAKRNSGAFTSDVQANAPFYNYS